MIKHTITRYRITLEAYRARMERLRGKHLTKGRWLTRDEAERLPFTSAHRKVLNHLATN